MRDQRHGIARSAIELESEPFIVPAGTLGEIGYMLSNSPPRLQRFLMAIADGSLILDCGEEDVTRIATLVTRYEDLRLGFADAAGIACAERNGGRVMTFDRRDFAVVAREGTIVLVP